MADRIKQFIDESYAKGRDSNRRVIIELDKFLNVAVVTVSIGNRIEIRQYLDGHEVETAWMIREERIRWIARMKAEGFTGKRIGNFLNFSAGTIYKDLRYLREERPNLLINLVPAAKLMTFSDIRVKRSRRTGLVVQ